MARDKRDKSEAERRVKAQMPMGEKMKRGDILVANSGSLEKLEVLIADHLMPALVRF